MQTIPKYRLATIALLVATGLNAQEARMRTPNPDVAPAQGVPRNAKFPYEGAWIGKRTLPVGTDDLTLRFVVEEDKYKSIIVLPNGQPTAERPVAVTSAGLTWEQANSGGGTWMYKVHLASPDSIVGTLMLNNAPSNITPAPAGTLTLKRAPATRSAGKL